MRKYVKALIVPVVLTGLSVSSAFAAGTGPDYTTLTDGVDWTSTIAAIMAIGAGAIGIVLAMVGLRKVIQTVRSI
ncbi:hypothetical protein RN068_000259 [Salmonella enterica]|nr:hypothetical protein [Salmonella enterica]